MVIGILTGMGENHRSEPSTDHISMHSKGTESLGEAGHHETREIMVAIEDFQCSSPCVRRQPYFKPLKVVKVLKDLLI